MAFNKPPTGGASSSLTPGRNINGVLFDGTSDISVPVNETWAEVTGNIVSVSNKQYLVNVTGGAIQITLPATPAIGDFVEIKHAAGDISANNITVDRNGSNIQGLAENLTISVDGSHTKLHYYNASRGWLLTEVG